MKVLIFAGARDVVGAGALDVKLDELPPTAPTAEDVMNAVCQRFPALEAHRPMIRLAVNGCYVQGPAPVGDGDEVALIPPIAGG